MSVGDVGPHFLSLDPRLQPLGSVNGSLPICLPQWKPGAYAKPFLKMGLTCKSNFH